MTDLMKYGEYAPTGFDSCGAFLEDQQDWLLAPVNRTRDSGPLSESNFEAALEILGGESDTVEVHRFGHWGPGWFEIILIHPSDERRVGLAEEIQRALENYPVLDDSDYSEREWECKLEIWRDCYDLADRVELCQRAGVSVFAARRVDEMPSDVDMYIEVE